MWESEQGEEQVWLYVFVYANMDIHNYEKNYFDIPQQERRVKGRKKEERGEIETTCIKRDQVLTFTLS